MKAHFTFKYLSILICLHSPQSHAAYYVLYSYLRTQEVIRIFSIVHTFESPSNGDLTTAFHSLSNSDNPQTIIQHISCVENSESFCSGRIAPVSLELDGNGRSKFFHGSKPEGYIVPVRKPMKNR